jgi:vacuolar-type H+-ATPase catalytic subunit A/Vma1
METPNEMAAWLCKLHNPDFDKLEYFDKQDAICHALATIRACKIIMTYYSETKRKGIEFCDNVEQDIQKIKSGYVTFEQFLEQREEPKEREQTMYTDEQKLEMLYEQEQQERYYFEQ